jgi:hypothetical protein
MKDDVRDLVLVDKLYLNDNNYKGENNLELIDMMADQRFTEKAISFKDVLYMKKEDYMKKLSNDIQLYKKENLKIKSKTNDKGDNTPLKNSGEILSNSTNFRISMNDNKMTIISSNSRRGLADSSKQNTINYNYQAKSNYQVNSVFNRKSKSIENFFEEILSSKVDFNIKENTNLLNEDEIKKRQLLLRLKTQKVQSLIKKPLGKSLAHYKSEFEVIKKENNIDSDLLMMLKNSSFIKKIRKLSIVRDDNRMFKEYTKFFRDIYNIKPPSINVLQSIKEIRDAEVRKSRSLSNQKPNSNFSSINSDKLNIAQKSSGKFSITNFKLNKNKSRNYFSPSTDETQNRTIFKINSFVKKKESFLFKTDVKSLVDNLDSHFRETQNLLKENFKIQENNNVLLRNTFTNTFSSVNRDFGKKGMMKETSMDMIKQFSKKGDFIYGGGSGYYSSSRKIINPVFNIIK